MNRSSMLISLVLIFAVVFVACGSTAAEPTPAPPTPTPTPAPTATPAISVITMSPEQDFDTVIGQMPEADVACIMAELGESRLKELATGTTELSEKENDILTGCFSNEFVAGFLAGQIRNELGTFSGSSMACVASLLADIPTGILTELVLGDGDDPSEPVQIAIQEFTLCLTNDELAALARVNAGEDAGGGSGSSGRPSSKDELCMVGELGQSFADGYGELLGGDLLLGFTDAIESCGIDFSAEGLISRLEDTERKYTVADFEAIGFKLSKSYDVKGLEEASSAHYGFYGIDPYKRLEYEARFYFSHEAAKSVGVDFANEASGAAASLYEDDQRWKEGLAQRRRCDSSGGHHVGRCGFPKYFDYVVAGNMVLMCQGKDTLGSLKACADLLTVVQ